MMRREVAISTLRGYLPTLRRDYGVRRISLFGSTARDEARDDLRTAAEVQQKLRFHNTGPQQIPGLIVMSLSEGTGKDWGACTGQGGDQHGEGDDYRFVVVLFNADKKAVTFSDPAFKGAKLQLHPYQHWLHPEQDAAGFQKKAGTFTVPSRTTAVFVCGGE
jgi:pullulanase